MAATTYNTETQTHMTFNLHILQHFHFIVCILKFFAEMTLDTNIKTCKSLNKC